MNNINLSRYRPGGNHAGIIDQVFDILEKAKSSKDAPKLKSSELDPVNDYVRQGFCVTEDDFIHPLDRAFSDIKNLIAARGKISSLWNETGRDPASKYVAGLVVNNFDQISLKSVSDVYILLDEIYETKMPDSVKGKDPVNAQAKEFYETSSWFEFPDTSRSQFIKALEQLIGADRLDQKFFKDPVNAFVSGDPIKEDPIAPEKKTTGIPPPVQLNSTPAKRQDKPNADKPADRLDPALAEVMEAISKKKKLGFQSGLILPELVADKTDSPAALKHLMNTLRTYKEKIKNLLKK